MAQIQHLDAHCLHGFLRAWMGRPSCQLEMQLVWSLGRRVTTSMNIHKLPYRISGFKKHIRQKGDIRLPVSGRQ